jgi:hypothetical protein
MQPAPTPYWPSIVVVPRSPGLFGASGEPLPHRNERARAKDSRAPTRHSARQPGPTLMFSGIALMIFGTATLFASCIAGMG